MLPLQYQKFKEELANHVDSDRIITNPIQLLAYGTDASFYKLVPKIVVQVHNHQEAVATLQTATRHNVAVTYRAAGTSLSGQAVTDSVLMVATHQWKKYEILNNGLQAKFQPGIIGGRANIILAPYGRKIGPDPGSINAAMIGGIAANNASGMCCGTSQNSYNTIADIKIVLYDGTVLDTANDESKKEFAEKHPEIIKEIERLRDAIHTDRTLYDRIERKFKIKNTTGYSLNAFIDYHDPYEIIKHIMIGSEGTLAFISDITYNTVINYKHKACTLMIFETIEKACQAVPFLKKSPVAAVELLDRNSIKSIEDEALAPEYFKTLPETACILLVEAQAENETEMSTKQQQIREAIASTPTYKPFEFTSEPQQYAFNWKARNGLLPTTGALRKTGTTCIIEDVAFPVEKLADACIAMKDLFAELQYHDAVLFGHALEGNLHLVFSQDFSTQEEIDRYARLMDGLVEIVVDRFDGSLKAEHGTGRNMAPFVEKEWGKQAYDIMLKVKTIFDPHNLVNPGVIINANPHVHLENFKASPATNEIVDKCIECGFCESHCVSEGLTLSPRQRIVVGREIARLQAIGKDTEELENLVDSAHYYADETCATDGLCALACPVKIDTGKYIKNIRHSAITEKDRKNAEYFVENMERVTAMGRKALNTVGVFQNILGNKIMTSVSSGMRKMSGNKIPQWNVAMPKGNKHKITEAIVNPGQDRKVVYFPSCINRTMGKSNDYPKSDMDLTAKTVELLKRAGYTIIYPENVNNMCCGMPFSSKGMKEEGHIKSSELELALLKATEDGRYPVLFDMSPCFYTFYDAHKDGKLKMHDPIEFMLDYVMHILPVKSPRKEISVFPVCSVKKVGLEGKLLELTKLCAEKVNYIDSNCCGFAGDRGFTFPELNKHGNRHLKEQIPTDAKDAFSTSRTCEIGLTEYGGVNFKSIFYLIDEVTK
ncbi:FAD-binding and (Fe-S)-binding domain-containing protein [Myroides odoratimimus]|uniref:FAD-binding and (Fe-S)-binding domain-containing protein n=1 Tax=Myroides odoratimimus TaxID=76832 RepID=UPI00217F4F0B|nr:FAD-binding and (Fe-S)-binding domain-containing protein [Myroides odoratimimus]MCS7474466.1 FAD-binding oxidoreductase [Myroides odoratimimus]